MTENGNNHMFGRSNGSRNGAANGNGVASVDRWWKALRGIAPSPELNLDPYRHIALQLHYDLPVTEGSRSVLLMSPTPSKLCAQGSAILACCLADELRRPILLVDVSAHDPEASRIMGCELGRGGWGDLLIHPHLRLDNLVLPTSHENVFFLSPGSAATVGGSVSAAAVYALLQNAQKDYDFIVLSGSAVLEGSLALGLSPYAGRVLLLVIENRTKLEELDAAQDLLAVCKARKVGLVLTTCIGDQTLL